MKLGKYCRPLILILCHSIFAPGLISQEAHVIEVEGRKIPFRFDPKRDVLVIEGEFLKRIPALNVPQLLSLVANMNFISRGLFQADPEMTGFNQEQITVMVNGAPINNAQTGHHNFALPFEIDQIQRIEILRGGSPSSYGFVGVGGLVNIITSGVNGIKVGVSSFKTIASSLDIGGENLSLSAGIMTTGGYMDGLDGRKGHIQGRAQFTTGIGSLDIWGGWVSSKFGASYFYGPYPSYEGLDRLLGVVSFISPLSGDRLLDVRLTSQYSVDDYKLFRKDPQFFTNVHKTRQNTLNAGIKSVGVKHSFYAGVSAHVDSIDSTGIRSGVSTLALGDHRRSLFSITGDYTRDIGRFFMNAGIQATAGTYDSTRAHVLAGCWLGKPLRISGFLTRNVRIPTYTELYYSDPVHRANQDLKPETGLSLALSLEYKEGAWEGGLRLFSSRIDNLIEWEMRPGETAWRSVNLRGGRYHGMDIKFGHEGRSASVRVLYTFQRTEFEDHPFSGSLKYHYYFPENMLSLLASGGSGNLSLSGSLKVETETLPAKAHIYLSLKAAYRLGKTMLTLEALNLFDTRVEKVPNLLEPPRSYSLGLAYGF